MGMTYRERREAKAARLRGWAEKRQQGASSVLARDQEIKHDWAFITQPGHIPERARIIAREDRAWASLGKAAEMRTRADGIEHQAANAIYSDDADAIERLQEKLADLEDQRARIVAFNAACRKAKSDRPTADNFATLTERQREDWFVVCQVGQTRKDGSFPAYATSNLGGNISRLRERIESLSRVAEQRERVRAALAAETADGYREYLPEPACAVCPERGFERDAIHHFASEHRYHAFVPAP